ncbi:SDR family NAD(P)-dependent oxidoreductase [Salibacterium halotolerans]|nr:SDR family oxidoreductase [Salibacterium halotolerans]
MKALITGGNGGIGKTTAETFLREGADVALVGTNEETLQQTKDELKELGNVLTISADVSNENNVARYVQKVINSFGRIDIFFNNAGIEGKVAPITEQSVEDFDKVMGVNVRGMFLGLKHIMPHMTNQGGGSIVNMSSSAVMTTASSVSPYISSKYGIVGLTKTAALEGATNNIRVNSIHPSPTNTRMMRSLENGMNPGNAEAVKEGLTEAIPLNCYAETQDVANLVLFLASNESKFITASEYYIDGGMSAT